MKINFSDCNSIEVVCECGHDDGFVFERDNVKVQPFGPPESFYWVDYFADCPACGRGVGYRRTYPIGNKTIPGLLREDGIPEDQIRRLTKTEADLDAENKRRADARAEANAQARGRITEKKMQIVLGAIGVDIFPKSE